jgi:hypothetical protein
MDVTVKVKRKIVYQGKEYASVDELPEALRHAYERALAGGEIAGAHTAVRRITFNGQEYDSLASMPPDVRAMYESIMRTVESQKGSAQPASGLPVADNAVVPLQTVSAAPIEPGGGISPRLLALAVLGVLVLLGLLALWFLRRPGG